MDVISMFLSIIAIIISIVIAIFQYKTNKNMANKGLEAAYYQKIFDEFLIDSIPEGRKKIIIDKQLRNAEDLVETLSSLKKRIVYFRYRDNRFYDVLNTKISELEDYLVEFNNHKINFLDIARYFDKIDQYINEIYDIIFENYQY